MNLAERYIDSVCVYIEHKVNPGDLLYDSYSAEEVLQLIGRELIGNRGVQVVNEVGVARRGDEFEGNEGWVEMINGRLHNLRQELALLVRSIRNSLTNASFGTIAYLATQLSRDWGIDAPTIIGITLVVIRAENLHLRMLIEADEVELGPIARIFWNSHISEAANEALEE